MEQQIRNENFREIELKKSMFNVKMFSLMKKQLFSLVMMLALVVLAGTSAWAQSGTLTNPIIQINGSAHTLHVDAHGTNTYSWATSATIVDDFTSYTGNDTRTLSYTWSETATGSFTFDVTETDPSETCKTTTRRIHVLVIDFDIIAYWSTGGANIEADAAQMNACSEGTEANYGDDPANLAFGQEIDLGNTGSVAGDLSTMVGTAPMTEREITLEIQWNLGTSSFDPAGLVGSIGFTYAFSITNENGTFVSFNGIATNQNGTTYVDGDADADGATWVIPVEYNSQWGIQDVISNVTIDACTLYSLAGGPAALGQAVIGVERNANVTGAGTATQNTTADQTIFSAPATTVIGVD